MCIGGIRGWFHGHGETIKSIHAESGTKVMVGAVATILVGGALFVGALYACYCMKGRAGWLDYLGAGLVGLSPSIVLGWVIFDSLFPRKATTRAKLAADKERTPSEPKVDPRVLL
ncbi:MAG: hypothetical protein K940chlam9_00389 [Chlamydiae bacterium]|nr:hypothetical protein [Chlamydiota bacterium]